MKLTTLKVLAFATVLGAGAARLSGRVSIPAHNQGPLSVSTNFSSVFKPSQELKRDVAKLRNDGHSCTCGLRNPDDLTKCKWQFSPDTFLAVLFGVGGIVEPFIIMMFCRQIYSSHMPQMQWLPSQGRNVFEHQPSQQRDPQGDMRVIHKHCVAQMSLQEKEELECEFDESMRPTTPPTV